MQVHYTESTTYRSLLLIVLRSVQNAQLPQILHQTVLDATSFYHKHQGAYFVPMDFTLILAIHILLLVGNATALASNAMDQLSSTAPPVSLVICYWVLTAHLIHPRATLFIPNNLPTMYSTIETILPTAEETSDAETTDCMDQVQPPLLLSQENGVVFQTTKD